MPAVAALYKVTSLMDLPLGEWKTRLGSLPDTAAAIYNGVYYATEAASYVVAELTSQIAEWANRPVVINVSSYLNKGAVAGYIVQANPIGQQAGRTAAAYSWPRERIGPSSCEGSFTTHLRVAGAPTMED